MKKIYILYITVILFLSFGLGEIHAHNNSTYYTDYYGNNYNSNIGTECQFSSVSVGVGILPDGVVVTIDSLDEFLTRCIKNSSWISYFNSFGNTVNIEVSNTTLGVQIVATSSNSMISTNLKNAQWAYLITGRSPTYVNNQYSNRIIRNTPKYIPRRKKVVLQDSNYYNNQPYYYNNQQYYYTPPQRTYVAGSTLFNTYQMFRSIEYRSNGVKMTLSSPDYQTMRTLQSYYFTGLFSDFSGISVSIVNIAGGVEVTVTSGSTSTIEEIQKIGNAIIYN